MADSSELFSDLNRLIDAWCERRALNPLRYLLAAYPLAMGTSDEWNELYKALTSIRGFCKDELEGDEMPKLNQAIVAVQRMLDGQR